MKDVRLIVLFCGLAAGTPAAQVPQPPRTEITKWQDGRQAAVAITYDDSTINQFRIALPLMNERGLVGTFFIITGQIPGSKHMPTFVGRPIAEILKESATVPTSEKNVYERTSVLRYLAEIQRNEIALANRTQPTNVAGVDAVLAKLRDTGQTYAAGAVPYIPVRSEEAQSGRPRADGPGGLSWDQMRKAASQGHEIANHSVSHARMTILDEANILYEVEKARDELRDKLGEKHTFSLESPYGIRDEHSREVLISRFDLVRNWVHDMDAEYMDGYMRGNDTDPATSKKPYLEWERGPVTATTVEQMKGWVDTSLETGAWLVLVIHGINGLGYQPLPTENVTAYFDYIKASSDSGKLWVATYQDQAKYIRERMRASIETKQRGQAIEVNVTHPLDARKYDVPLTARTTVPAQWTSAKATQGRDSSTTRVQQDATGTYVQYRMMPNGGAVRIERAQ
jgi:peptidoglycan/xylan/chitin deacetylase (PgdA/CDA1 family)